MTLRLIYLEIDSRPGGLHLPRHSFADFLTNVQGDNGSGKTAVMTSLYWALGGARQASEPVWSQAAGVRLVFTSASGEAVIVYRAFSEHLAATLDVNGKEQTFSDEAAFSEAMLPLLGMAKREWTGRNGGPVVSYSSVVLPAFAVDQDNGWVQPYVPFSHFVEDQGEEVARLILSLPQRHDPKRDNRRKALTVELATLDAAIESRGRALTSIESALPRDGQQLESMRLSRARLETELRQFDTVLSSMAEVDASLRSRLAEAIGEHEAAAREVNAAAQRRAVLEALMQEGKGDLELIGTNEVAADAFRKFCGNPACQFFAGTSEPTSYGRRVLYLRDQFKDITAAMDAASGAISSAAERLVVAEARLSRAKAEHEAATRAKASDRVVAAVDGVARELAAVTRNVALGEQVAAERQAREMLQQRRQGVFEDLGNHDESNARSRKSVAGVARDLGEVINRWLAVLKTNEGGAISVNDELRVTVNGKVLADKRGPSGSSRVRLVLAYHAALLEISLERGGQHPPLLLFDAPKQHELDPVDFGSYLTELRRVFAKRGVQVVMSSRTEMSSEGGDTVWRPTFPGERHAWYLGREVPDGGSKPR